MAHWSRPRELDTTSFEVELRYDRADGTPNEEDVLAVLQDHLADVQEIKVDLIG